MHKAFSTKLLILSSILLFNSSCSLNKSKQLNQHSKKIEINDSQTQNIANIIEHNNKVILRDNWGVPHVYGTTDKDAAYALAYAHAEDDFVTIQNALLKARGTYASVYGAGENNINAIFDYMVGLLKIWENIDSKYQTDLSPETIELCEGYAEGLNAYIEDNKSSLDEYIYPVSGKDVIAGTIHKTPFFFQLPLFLSDLYFKAPSEIPSDYTTSDVIDKIKGSNVYAISPKLSDDKSTILGINSHQPFEGELAWYEAHINSKDGWNMIGGLFPGSPVVLVGHNESLGWGHTVNKPDILDIYELEVNPENDNQYKFDGKWIDMEEYIVEIKIKTIGKIKIKHKQKAFWSKQGPVIKGEKATYAIRYSNMDNIQIIEQWYKMNKADNFDEWLQAIETISVPMFNTGYADKEGNIFYIYSAKTPDRNPDYNWKGVLPGNTSKTLWNSYKSFNDLPSVLNPKSGFIQNCNSSPFQTTTGEDNPLENNYDHTYGIETHMTNRALRALETIGEDKTISYDEFLNYKYDFLYSKESTMNYLINKTLEIISDKEIDKLDKKTLASINKTLKNWNLSSDRNNTNAAFPILAFSKILDMHREKITDEIIISQIILAAEFLNENYNTINCSWGDVNRLVRGDVNIPLDGAPDVPRAIYTVDFENGQKKAFAGDCYILIAKWDENKRVKSESIHQYGASTSNIDSEHYSDQTELFANNKLKNISIHLEDIAKTVKSITILDKDIN